MQPKQSRRRAHLSISILVMVLLFSWGATAADWRTVVSADLAALISPRAEGERVVIVELERATAPDLAALTEAYSLASRTTWLSDSMQAYREQLSTICELEPGLLFRREDHGIWETTSAYIAFSHALIVRCAIQDIPHIGSLPFVTGVHDGESEITVLQSYSDSHAIGGEDTDLSTWIHSPIDPNDLTRCITVQGWLPLPGTVLASLQDDPFAVSALSSALPIFLEEEDQFVGLSTDSLPLPAEAAEDGDMPWPYGLSMDSFAAINDLSHADLLLCADAAFHVQAEQATLCTITLDEGGDSSDETAMVALFWRPVSRLGVAATGPVESGETLSELPLSGLPATEVFATMGAHADRVVLEWSDLGGIGVYEVLKADLGDPVYQTIGITDETVFSDWDVETCSPYTYVVRLLSTDGVGQEAHTGKGYIGSVPEVVDWIVATDSVTGDGGVNIEWAPSLNATEYVLWRSEPVSTPYQSATKVYCRYRGPDTSFLDLDVVAGTDYRYCAVPYNGCGASAVGNPAAKGIAMFVMPPEGNPKPPNWLTASLVTPADQVNLSWRAVSGVSEYRIYRAAAYPGPYEWVWSTADLSWSDTSAEHCQDYWYRIQSLSGEQEGPLSAVVHGVCGGKPGRPSGVIASDSTYADAIRLDWGAGHEAEYYHIFRANSLDGPYTKIAATYELFFIDVGLEPGQTFWYRVAARNLCGGSGYCDPVWGATIY